MEPGLALAIRPPDPCDQVELQLRFAGVPPPQILARAGTGHEWPLVGVGRFAVAPDGCAELELDLARDWQGDDGIRRALARALTMAASHQAGRLRVRYPRTDTHADACWAALGFQVSAMEPGHILVEREQDLAA